MENSGKLPKDRSNTSKPMYLGEMDFSGFVACQYFAKSASSLQARLQRRVLRGEWAEFFDDR